MIIWEDDLENRDVRHFMLRRIEGEDLTEIAETKKIVGSY
jgi:hypothetical protein